MGLATVASRSRPLLRLRPRRLDVQPRAARRHTSNASKPPSSSASSEPPNPATSIPTPNTIPPSPPLPPSSSTTPALWTRLGPLSTFFAFYSRSQRRRPYVTQLCSSLVIYFLGDLGAQYVGAGEEDEYDVQRTMRSLVIGGISSIPSYKWFLFLSQNFNFSSHIFSLAVKISINQTCFTPIFNSYFFGMQSLLSGDTPAQALERIRATVPTSIINSCKLWPAVTAFSFTFVRVEYRSVFQGIIAVGWQTYLAMLNRRAELAARQEGAVKERVVAGRGEAAAAAVVLATKAEQ